MKKSKPPKKSMHLSIGKDLMDKVKEFSDKRGNTMTDSVWYALTQLFKYEGIDPTKDNILKEVVERRFSLPEAFTLRSFWMFLYMLSDRYGDQSSRKFWGEVVYLSGIDKTHKEIYNELHDESSRLLKRAWNEKKKAGA
jgi:hypothetical protein